MAASLIPKAQTFLDNHLNVLLIARHGVGKTYSVLEETNKRGLKLKYYSCATLDPYTDLVGVPVPRKDENGVEHLVMVRPRDIDEAEVVFFDELNRADPKVLNAVFEIIQFGSINGEKLPNLQCCWAAINPPGGEYEVEDLDPALIDRFDAFIELEPRVNPQWMEENGLPKEIAMALTTWWGQHDNDKRGVENFISPRRLMTIGQVFMATGDPRVAIPKWINCERQALATLLGRAMKDFEDRTAAEKQRATASAQSGLGPNPNPAGVTGGFGTGRTDLIDYDHRWIEQNKGTVVNYLKQNPEDIETHVAVMNELKNRQAPRLGGVFAEVLEHIKPAVLEGFVDSLDKRRKDAIIDVVHKLPGSRPVPNLRKALGLG